MAEEHRPSPPRVTARAALRPLLIAVALLLVYYLLPLDDDFEGYVALALLCGLVGVTALFVWEVRAVTRADRPRLRAVQAFTAVVTLFLLLFAAGYFMLSDADTAAFTEPLTRTDALYFALTTFATVGYGDIAAVSQPARIAAMLQMAFGLLLVGVAAKVLVGAVNAAFDSTPRSRPPS
ncbi:potassium channel family protein [Streptomyces alkaliterrae]|uniref:potassium channel family protein n=1 Tax=Streptomyces alkaliterrae TaxID=2213162 RepID=UPI002B21B0C1|nr:potassium channel family protein [Streptomyces alkaliterrae]